MVLDRVFFIDNKGERLGAILSHRYFHVVDSELNYLGLLQYDSCKEGVEVYELFNGQIYLLELLIRGDSSILGESRYVNPDYWDGYFILLVDLTELYQEKS